MRTSAEDHGGSYFKQNATILKMNDLNAKLSMQLRLIVHVSVLTHFNSFRISLKPSSNGGTVCIYTLSSTHTLNSGYLLVSYLLSSLHTYMTQFLHSGDLTS